MWGTGAAWILHMSARMKASRVASCLWASVLSESTCGHCTLSVAGNSTHRVTHILSLTWLSSLPSPQLKDHPQEEISYTGEAEEDRSWTSAPFTVFPNAHSSLERELAALLFRSPTITLHRLAGLPWPEGMPVCIHL